jgi:hypothetical protein
MKRLTSHQNVNPSHLYDNHNRILELGKNNLHEQEFVNNLINEIVNESESSFDKNINTNLITTSKFPYLNNVRSQKALDKQSAREDKNLEKILGE